MLQVIHVDFKGRKAFTSPNEKHSYLNLAIILFIMYNSIFRFSESIEDFSGKQLIEGLNEVVHVFDDFQRKDL